MRKIKRVIDSMASKGIAGKYHKEDPRLVPHQNSKAVS